MHPLRPAFDGKAGAGPKRGPVPQDHGSALMSPCTPSEWGRRHCECGLRGRENSQQSCASVRGGEGKRWGRKNRAREDKRGSEKEVERAAQPNKSLSAEPGTSPGRGACPSGQTPPLGACGPVEEPEERTIAFSRRQNGLIGITHVRTHTLIFSGVFLAREGGQHFPQSHNSLSAEYRAALEESTL